MAETTAQASDQSDLTEDSTMLWSYDVRNPYPFLAKYLNQDGKINERILHLPRKKKLLICINQDNYMLRTNLLPFFLS